MFELEAGSAGFALAGNGDTADTDRVQVAFEGCFAVAAVGGDRARWAAGAAGDPLDRGSQLWRVRRGALWSRMIPSALSTIWAL